MRVNLGTLATWAEGRLLHADPEAEACGVSVDSRTVRPRELFVAISGPNFNGHDYAAEALAKGATAMVVQREEALQGRAGIVVDDSRAALARMAHQFRWQGHLMPWIAVTGSNGKTTTREIIVRLLQPRGPVCSPVGNYNNEIGLPLTMLNCIDDAVFGVVEMGANAPGEIARLTDIATPTVAVVTNIGPAHLEGLKDLEAVAREKASIYKRLPQDGLGIYPARDPHARLLREAIPATAVSFAVEAEADLVAENPEADEEAIRFTARGVRFEVPILGAHNIENCLAALLAAGHFGVTLDAAAETLKGMWPLPNRMERFQTQALTVINDAYNANPDSLMRAVEAMLHFDGSRRVVIVGDMLELGAESRRYHKQLGRWLGRSGVDVLLAVGKETLALAEAAAGASARVIVRHFTTVQALLGHLNQILNKGDLVLVKGSRGMKLERVVKALKLYDAETG